MPMKVSSNGIHSQMEIIKRTRSMNLINYIRIATDNAPSNNKKLKLNSSSNLALEKIEAQANHDFNYKKMIYIHFLKTQENKNARFPI